jgi:outer membrane protein OmpA-like peptidoglycan-associated protein
MLLTALVGYSSENFYEEDSLKYLKTSNRSLLSQARKAADNDSYEDVKSLYFELLRRDSTNSTYNYECGVNYFLNLFEQPLSLPYFQRALKYSTKDTIQKIYYYLGQAYQLNNRYSEAISAYKNYLPHIKKNRSALDDVTKKIVQCEQGLGYLATFNKVINIDNVGQNINSNEAEYVPVVKADESVMYFTARRKTNIGGEKDPESNRYYEDMFISKGDSGKYQVGERFMLGDTLTKRLRNTGAHESVVSLSYDEKVLITFKNNSLWWSNWVNEGWEKPQRLSKKINFGKYQNHGSLSAKNDTLYFSSDGSGGYGGMDLYMSIKSADGNWGKSINLGPLVNTSEDEDSPSIDYDNVTLYFSSKGHNSMGGYDVYKTVYDNGNWANPLNLGMPINSSGDDIYFKYDKNKKQAYFSSSRQRGFGDYDIYRLINYETPRFDDCREINNLSGFPVSLDAKKLLGPRAIENNVYHWEFSDGENGEGDKIEHNFKEPGEYCAKLYVLDPILLSFIEQKDTVIQILNENTLHFTIADTISVDSLLSFDGTPTKIENSTILKYHWDFGDSTAGSDSCFTQHAYKDTGTYKVRLSMVARNDSTEKVFQKCVSKSIHILNKEKFVQFHEESVQRANRKKGFTTEMLAQTRLYFLAADTTARNVQNVFDATPVFIPSSNILSYNWDLGDTLKRLNARSIRHTYDSVGLYKVKLNVIFQLDSNKRIFEREMNKNITVLSPEDYEKLAPVEKITAKSKRHLESQFDTVGIPIIELENIYFDYDKFAIRDDAKEALLRNITKLGIDTLLAIKVSANTDSRGSKSYNFKLSAKRAISAINFMAAHNIARKRIIAVVSMGETNLVNRCGDNVKCNEKEHQLNRRDEFHVVGRIKK